MKTTSKQQQKFTIVLCTMITLCTILASINPCSIRLESRAVAQLPDRGKLMMSTLQTMMPCDFTTWDMSWLGGGSVNATDFVEAAGGSAQMTRGWNITGDFTFNIFVKISAPPASGTSFELEFIDHYHDGNGFAAAYITQNSTHVWAKDGMVNAPAIIAAASPGHYYNITTVIHNANLTYDVTVDGTTITGLGFNWNGMYAAAPIDGIFLTQNFAGAAHFKNATCSNGASFTTSPNPATPGSNVNCTWTGAAPAPATWHWNFGDSATNGTNATSVLHKYTVAGSYVITLWVESIDGDFVSTATVDVYSGYQLNLNVYSTITNQSVPIADLQIYVNTVRVSTTYMVLSSPNVTIAVLDTAGRVLLSPTSYTLNASFTVIDVPLLYVPQVFFKFFSTIDYFGVSFDDINLFVNGSCMARTDPPVSGTSVNVTVQDFSNTTIYSNVLNLSVTGVNIRIGLDMATIILKNNFNEMIVVTISRNGITTVINLGPTMSIERRFACGSYTCTVRAQNGTVLDNGTIAFTKADESTFSVSFGPVLTPVPNIINEYPNPIIEIVEFSAILALVLGAIDITARAVGNGRKKQQPFKMGKH